jgi:hypothetical protein
MQSCEAPQAERIPAGMLMALASRRRVDIPDQDVAAHENLSEC